MLLNVATLQQPKKMLKKLFECLLVGLLGWPGRGGEKEMYKQICTEREKRRKGGERERRERKGRGRNGGKDK